MHIIAYTETDRFHEKIVKHERQTINMCINKLRYEKKARLKNG